MTTATDTPRPFLPGMGRHWLLPFYDPLTRLLGLQGVRRTLVADADLRPGHRVLDIGCGTGSLVVAIKQRHPKVEVAGLDPDPAALARADRKARRRGLAIRFDRGFSDQLGYRDATFDRVFSSFMLHHLAPDEKARTADEVCRVLKPGGVFHLMDFAPHEAARRPPLAGAHGHQRLTGNDDATVLGLLRSAGFHDVARTGERVILRSLRVVSYRARRAMA